MSTFQRADNQHLARYTLFYTSRAQTFIRTAIYSDIIHIIPNYSVMIFEVFEVLLFVRI